MRKLRRPSFPDFSQRSVVDRHLERLDTQGVSRRDFLAFASAAASAGTYAAVAGLPSVAVAAPSGKLAYLSFDVNEYNTQASLGFKQAADSFGLRYALLDGEESGQKQVDQFEQQEVAGVQGAVFNLADGGSVRRIASLGQQNTTYFGNFWNTLPWFTPFDASEYYTLYAVPQEFTASRAVTTVLLDKITRTFGGGKIIAVTGSDGYVTDIARSRGRDAALKAFPKITLADHLPGKWNREDSLKATEDLLTRDQNVVGIVAQNDDEAQGVLAALRDRGLTPGKDVFVVGADGTAEGIRAVAAGTQLATSGNSPAYAAALFTARVYDVTHGWVPRAAERMLNWHSVILTQENAEVYNKRFVDNNGVLPFDYRKLSKVLHPTDWDPQAEVTPLDIDLEWAGIPKPPGFQYPKAYLAARANGEAEAVRQDYASHYKIKFDGPSPNAKS